MAKTIFRMYGDEKMFNELQTIKNEGRLNVESIELTRWRNGDPKYIFVVEKVDFSNRCYDKALRMLNAVNEENHHSWHAIFQETVADKDVEHKIEFLNC